jgi:arylsulfatase A-like enzyme
MDVDTPVSNLDVMPTFADLVDLPPHPSFQGRSLLSAGGGDDDARAIFMNIQGLRTSEAVVCWPYKLIVEHTGGRVRLFHLEQDPGELTDLASKNVRVAESLRQTLRSQIRGQVEYHGKDSSLRQSRYAPRLARCPALGNQRRTADSANESMARSTRRPRPEPAAGALAPTAPPAPPAPVAKNPGG